MERLGYTADGAAVANPAGETAYILNRHEHWFSVRKIGKYWFDLNSVRNARKSLRIATSVPPTPATTNILPGSATLALVGGLGGTADARQATICLGHLHRHIHGAGASASSLTRTCSTQRQRRWHTATCRMSYSWHAVAAAQGRGLLSLRHPRRLPTTCDHARHGTA
eukprot:SAG11_NODE_2721_length_3044_cov_10.912733_3_plen_167_part_00